MLDQIRSAIELASGVAEIPRRQAERFARSLAKRGDLRLSQVSTLAESIVERSRSNAEMVRSIIRSEIRRQVRALGLATKDDLERLSRRIQRLEGKPGPKKPARKAKPAGEG